MPAVLRNPASGPLEAGASWAAQNVGEDECRAVVVTLYALIERLAVCGGWLGASGRLDGLAYGRIGEFEVSARREILSSMRRIMGKSPISMSSTERGRSGLAS